MKFADITGATPAQAGEGAKKKRVVIVEDQRMVAEFLASHCTQLGLEVVARCSTCETGLAAVLAHRPELLLLDISLPDGDGLQVATIAMLQSPLTKVLAISGHRDAWTMLQVQRLGLHGYVDKTEQRTEVLSEAIHAVFAGQIYYTPVVNESSAHLRRDPKAFIHVLSDYELRVLALIGESKSDDEIAAMLNVTASTVQSRRRDIMRKLDIHSTPKLIHYAIMHGVTRPDKLAAVRVDLNVTS